MVATGRSREAIEAKLGRLTGSGSLRRGSYCLQQLHRETGYTPEQLRRAASALNQKWKRLKPTGSFLVTEEQRDEVIEWLKHDYWAAAHRLYCCQHCTTDHRRHKALGLCARCYGVYSRLCQRHGIAISPVAQAEAIVEHPECARLPPDVLRRMQRGLAADIDHMRQVINLLGDRRASGSGG